MLSTLSQTTVVGQSVMSATDTLGYCIGMSIACLEQILIRDSGLAFEVLYNVYAQGCWHAITTDVGNCPPPTCWFVRIIQHLIVMTV